MTWNRELQERTVLAAVTDRWSTAGEICDRLPEDAPGFGDGYFNGASLAWPLKRLAERGEVERAAGDGRNRAVQLYRRPR